MKMSIADRVIAGIVTWLAGLATGYLIAAPWLPGSPGVAVALITWPVAALSGMLAYRAAIWLIRGVW